MVSTDALNMAPYTDPANMLIESAQPENVDTVMVDGRILKQGGRLTAIETGEVVGEARQSLQEVRKRAAWK
jgi:cytosine/adenosine deaminase-related metal-dependent hydrolase